MNITSTAELRRIELQQGEREQANWLDRLESFWAHVSDSLSPKRKSQSRRDDIEPIMSIGDD